MPEQQLREALEELHGELEQAPSLDQETRDLLRLIAGDIHELLARREEAGPEDPQSIVERLKDATVEFEDSHPSLTARLGRLLDLMGRTFP